MRKKAIIIGAGPAGLTAAYELLKRTDIIPIVVEKCGEVGGISKTVNYKGNRMDFGPHRFFSKSDRVMAWWLNMMPLQKIEDENVVISYQNKHRTIDASCSENAAASGKNMLLIKRLTRIYFLRKFFPYPIQLSMQALKQLGLARAIKIVLSYVKARLMPRKPEISLEDFMINKFGRELYLTFFKDYTEKVWGISCQKIAAEWGAQRIKGVSLSKAMLHAVQSIANKKPGNIAQKSTETSLIEQFLYPALGAGQLWEEVARQVQLLGGKIIHDHDVKQIFINDNKVTGVLAVNAATGENYRLQGDYFFSTMPVQELIAGIGEEAPEEARKVAVGLQYRDFIAVGVLVKQLSAYNINKGRREQLDLKDSWIYIQEKDVKVARMQIYNNWGPYMVKDAGTVWLGLEYFCNKGDAIWNMTDKDIERLAVSELHKMNLIQPGDVLDSTVKRMEKTYPAYFGSYNQFDVIRNYVDRFENLFLIGRNGMHKYNNSDHSMLTAMVAVDNICEGVTSKDNLWAINTEQEYHEEKKGRELEEIEMVTSKARSGVVESMVGKVNEIA